MSCDFTYSSVEDIRCAAQAKSVVLPLSENLEVLKEHLTVEGHTLPNRLSVQPMEGCDGMAGGAPGGYTCQRYRRFAESGAGLIWFEATAIVPEGRANPRQLMLTEQNVDEFSAVVEDMRARSLAANGFEPLMILQMTHSGRYSKPEGTPAPHIAYHCASLEKTARMADCRPVSDDYLARLPEQYARMARLAVQAGFDGVDVKACHRYLVNELLCAYTRPGRYGGSFENRTRLLCEAIEATQAVLPGGKFVTTRLNLYDGLPYPFGWGAAENSDTAPDMTEPIRLVSLLYEQFGIRLINGTIGNPYFNPHVNRPFSKGPYESPESPLVGLFRMCRCISQVKQAVPAMTVIASGFSYLRQFSPCLAAGMVESGGADIAGFGRMAFAYPRFAHEMLKTGKLQRNACCVACSKCSDLMRVGCRTGCVVHDTDDCRALYQREVIDKKAVITVSGMEGSHLK